MKNLNYKVFLYIILGISAIVWVVIAALTGKNMSQLNDFFGILPTVASVDLVIYFGFRQWGWKWKAFHDWLVPFPNLSGTWQGYAKTTWKNPKTGEVLGSIPVILTIKQSFDRISCVMRTLEMTSYSFSEGFRIEKDNQIKQLAYIYTSKPKYSLDHRSLPHDGTIVFDIIGNPTTKLIGQYWTSRKSTGEIKLTYWGEEILDEIPEDLANHPMKVES
ncbi:hypothetical protein ACFL6W_07940 [Thermodesulfobacteriota bacterium]